MGTVRPVNAAMPYLEKSKSASIVTIASVSGREIDFAAGPYGAFKAALTHYTQGLAFSLAPKRSVQIRCLGAILISPAGSGKISRKTIQNCFRRRWP